MAAARVAAATAQDAPQSAADKMAARELACCGAQLKLPAAVRAKTVANCGGGVWLPRHGLEAIQHAPSLGVMGRKN